MAKKKKTAMPKAAVKVALPAEISVVLAGEAGQGIQSIESVLVNVMKKSGYNVFATKEYMSRVRGGINSTQIRISEKAVASYTEKTDIFIPLDKGAIPRHKDRLQKSTLIIGDKESLQDERVKDVPFSKMAVALGNEIYSGMIAVGVVCGIMQVEKTLVYSHINKLFIKKGQEVVDGNVKSFEAGFSEGVKIAQASGRKYAIKKDVIVEEQILLSGAESVALGAIAGGCNSVFAYPMTPSTGVFTALAGYSTRAGIAVEQVEDEIGVMNMALGAWYAGSRAMVSTAGGGFALMTEGVSLSGMTETPVVIHLAQRPGPATGLPTRTEQGDLNLALNAGHGVFPRIILAPGNTRQGFSLSQKAFNLADKYQVPVFIMTDQYFVDSYYNTPMPDTEKIKNIRYVTKTTPEYKRYALTKDGISPRGIPGNGTGTVCSDSDEHDEDGRITEDLTGISMAMKIKRFKKFALVGNDAIAPELFGPKKYKTLYVGWGSVMNSVIEALELSGVPDAAFLHFSQVFPLHKSALAYLKIAKRVIAVENNQTGQFAELIKQQTGFEIKEKILKYDGMPFSVGELMDKIRSAKKRGA
jgi:2-oxoglutarate ferredoxin oxidoreductase subunit alpha